VQESETKIEDQKDKNLNTNEKVDPDNSLDLLFEQDKVVEIDRNCEETTKNIQIEVLHIDNIETTNTITDKQENLDQKDENNEKILAQNESDKKERENSIMKDINIEHSHYSQLKRELLDEQTNIEDSTNSPLILSTNNDIISVNSNKDKKNN